MAHPAGGANPALAHSIAAKHPGNHSSHVTESLAMCHMLMMLVSPVTSAPGEESDNETVQVAHRSPGKGMCMTVHVCVNILETSFFIMCTCMCCLLHNVM